MSPCTRELLSFRHLLKGLPACPADPAGSSSLAPRPSDALVCYPSIPFQPHEHLDQ